MRLHSVFSLALATTLAGCAGAAGPADTATPQQDGTPLRVGTPIHAMLAEGDPTWGMNGRFHLYRFDARAGDRFSIDLRSDDFDAYLVVGDRSGGIFNPIDQDDDGGEGLNSRIRFVSPRDDTFWVLAQALSDYGTGDYTIELSALPAPQPAVPMALAVGGNALGELTDGDAVLEDESFYDLYTFRGEAGQRYAISMSSPSFDTYLHVGTGTGNDFSEIARDDDSGEGTDSRVLFTPDRDGVYSVQASSYASEATGDYSLSIMEMAPPGPRVVLPIAVGGTVTGDIDESDAMSDDGVHEDWYSFRGEAGQRLATTLRSADFDAYLELGTVDENGVFHSERSDDDGGGGLDSRIVTTLENDGEYVIRASPLYTGTGRYTLSLETLAPPGPAAVTPIGMGQTMNGTLELSDAMLDDGSHYDIYTFRGEAGRRVRVTLRSHDFDAYLAFGTWRDGQVVVSASDDDSGGGLDSQIEATLLSSGEYAIRANSLGSGETGSYSVTLEQW